MLLAGQRCAAASRARSAPISHKSTPPLPLATNQSVLTIRAMGSSGGTSSNSQSLRVRALSSQGLVGVLDLHQSLREQRTQSLTSVRTLNLTQPHAPTPQALHAAAAALAPNGTNGAAPHLSKAPSGNAAARMPSAAAGIPMPSAASMRAAKPPPLGPLDAAFDVEAGQGADCSPMHAGKDAHACGQCNGNGLYRMSSEQLAYQRALQTPKRTERVHGDHDDHMVRA